MGTFFKSGEGVAVGIFLIIFLVGYPALAKRFENKGIAAIIILCVSAIAAGVIYTKGIPVEWAGTLAVALYILVIVAFLRIVVLSMKRVKKARSGEID